MHGQAIKNDAGACAHLDARVEISTLKVLEVQRFVIKVVVIDGDTWRECPRLELRRVDGALKVGVIGQLRGYVSEG
jgi:hypothetical protein